MKNNNYPLNQVETIRDIRELLEKAAARYDDKTAFLFRSRGSVKSVTYLELKEDVDALGTALFGMGIRNEKIAILGENSYAWIVTYLSAINSSNIAVPVDKELSAKEIGELLLECDCRVIAYASSYMDMIPEISGIAKGIKTFIEMGLLAQQATDRLFSFEGLLEKGNEMLAAGDVSFINHQVDTQATAAIIYTSGTTGKSKGVMLTHANLAADTVAGLQNVKFGERSLLVLPLHHTFPLTGGVLIMLHTGSAIFITSSLKTFAQDMQFHKPNDILLVPMFVESLYKKIWDAAQKKGKDQALKKLIRISNALLKLGIDARRKLFGSVLESFGGCLTTVITGGALMDPKYIRGFRDFGINVLNGYGITECSPVVSVNRNRYFRDGSIGLPLACCEAKIDSPDENGEGEIYIRGAITMKGYYNNPEATQAAFDGEWFKTGDIGKLDTDGFLFITGRIKNIIVLNNGKNVYPEELEMRILNLPYVSEAVVYAKQDSPEEEAVIAAEVFFNAEYLKEHPIDHIEAKLNEDIEQINKELPTFKRIAVIRTRDKEFEKTASKKIKRNTVGGSGNV